jgi:DNA-binding transcriptional LysR family regulator
MHMKSLKVFCDVAAHRSFSVAAAENGVTQSAASQVVNHVEEYLGVKLLDRSKRPFELTPAGELFYARGRRLVGQFYRLKEKVQLLDAGHAGHVHVASIYSVGLSHMNQCVKEFLSRYPTCNVRIEYQHPDRVHYLVERGRAHLGLVSYPKSSRTIRAIPWREEQIVVACSPEHPLATQGPVSLPELHGQSVVGYDERLRIQREIDRALAAAGAEVNVVMRFDNTETIKRAVEIAAGIGFLPGPTLTREIAAGTLVAVPLADPMVRPLGMIQRRDGNQPTEVRSFVELLLEHAAKSPVADARPSAALSAVGDDH